MAFDFAAITAPFRMQPGMRRLAPGGLSLTPNQTGSRAQREKLAVLTSFWPQALVTSAGFDAQPALQTLLACAAREQPGLVLRSGSTVVAPALGWSLTGGSLEPEAADAALADPAIGRCLRALPPEWRLAGLLSLAFADDFAVIDSVTATVPWLAVCLPSSWAPERKVGLHFAEIHAPVADNATLIAAGEHLARLVAGPDRWERFVWTLTPDPRLHRHPERADPSAWPADAPPRAVVEQTFLRTERQAFLPVDGASQAIFTIHVEVRPLFDVLGDAAVAQQLHDALASMSDAVLAYRGLADARDRLLEGLRPWAARTASGAAASPPVIA